MPTQIPEELLEPTIGKISRIINNILVIAALVFLLIFAFTGAGWGLIVATLIFAAVVIGNIAETRLIVEANEKKLDFLLRNL